VVGGVVRPLHRWKIARSASVIAEPNKAQWKLRMPPSSPVWETTGQATGDRCTLAERPRRYPLGAGGGGSGAMVGCVGAGDTSGALAALVAR